MREAAPDGRLSVWLVQRSDVVGGTKAIIDGLRERLTEKGFNAHAVYIRSREEHVAARRGAVARVGADWRDFRRLVSQMMVERPRLILTFTPLLGAVLALMSRFVPGVKVIATHHSLSERASKIALGLDKLAASLGAYHRVVACSHAVATSYERRGPRYRCGLSVITNGVASTYAPRGSDAARARRRQLMLPEGASVVFSAGRLTPGKNVVTLVRALVSAPDWYLIIAGDGVARAELDREAMRLGVAERVRFLGLVPREIVHAWLLACDLFALPSRYEGLSLVLLEAMARGTPTVASDTPENRDPLIGPTGPCGLLVAADDPAAWAAAMRFVREHEDEAAVLGQRAQVRQRQEFEEEQMYDAYVDLIGKTLEA